MNIKGVQRLSKDDDIDSIELCGEANDMCSEKADVVEVEHPTTVNSYFDAIKALEDVCWYLEQKGNTDEATIVSSFVSTVADISYKALASSRQSHITDFLKQDIN